MFWIWIRGGPFAVLALVLVMVVFVVLFVASARVAPWLAPFVIVPAGIAILVVAARRPRGSDRG